jgi:hypothetical protein
MCTESQLKIKNNYYKKIRHNYVLPFVVIYCINFVQRCCSINIIIIKNVFRRLNCDSAAMKAMRQFYERPYYLAPSVAPANYNWVIISSRYKTTLFKRVNTEIIVNLNETCNVFSSNWNLA